MDLSNHKIIFIHGIASKPPKDDLLALWAECLIENVKQLDPALADAMLREPGLFEMAYWANAVPNHIEDDPAAMDASIEEVLKLRRELGNKFHVPRARDRFKAFWIDKGLDAVDLVGNVLSVKDDVAKKKLIEVGLYWGDQFTATRIREALLVPLRQALEEGKRVAVIAHSMGTFVAYDVLWRLCHHRDEAGLWGKRVRLLVTLGSPLGDKMIQERLLGNRHELGTEAGLLTNLDYWANFATLGDVVAHDMSLKDDFSGILTHTDIKGFRDYKGLYNPFRSPSGRKNPHKSYGYLLQPKLAKRMVKFFAPD